MNDPNMHAYGTGIDHLKPCPFCGAAAEIITLEGEDDPGVGAQCVQCTSSACGAASGLVYPLMDDVTGLLYERWNRRTQPAMKDIEAMAEARAIAIYEAVHADAAKRTPWTHLPPGEWEKWRRAANIAQQVAVPQGGGWCRRN